MSMKINDDEVKFDFSFFESEESLLNMSMTYVKKESRKRSKSKAKVLLIFLAIIFILETFFFPKTKYISLLLFANNDYKRCTLLNKLNLYQYNIRYIFLFFMFSYLNIYSTFCYLVLDILANILNDIIRFLYFEPRPFWEESNNVFPCTCELTPSSPSPTANNSFIFLSLVYFLKEEIRQKNKTRRMNSKRQYKEYKDSNDENSENRDSSDVSQFQFDKCSNLSVNILLFFIIALIIFTDAIPLLQNIEYLHQTIFGISLGFALYYWVFHILRVNHLNKKQFIKIVTQPGIVMTFSIIIIFIILVIYNNNTYRIYIGQIEQIQKFCEIPKDFKSSKEILKNCIHIFEILGAYYGLILEYKITFKSDDFKYTLYNIKSKNGEVYSDEKGAIIKLLRFLLLFFIEIVFFRTIIEFWVKNNLQGWLQIFVLCLVMFFKGIFFFYFIKIILTKLKILNDKIFDEEYDDE